eukprot:scaffold51565_cov74-Phaeocystis_antarctica.AAC.3
MLAPLLQRGKPVCERKLTKGAALQRPAQSYCVSVFRLRGSSRGLGPRDYKPSMKPSRTYRHSSVNAVWRPGTRGASWGHRHIPRIGGGILGTPYPRTRAGILRTRYPEDTAVSWGYRILRMPLASWGYRGILRMPVVSCG